MKEFLPWLAVIIGVYMVACGLILLIEAIAGAR